MMQVKVEQHELTRSAMNLKVLGGAGLAMMAITQSI